jgi:hypothetical protein
MKRTINVTIFLIIALSVNGQANKEEILRNLEKNQSAPVNSTLTATLKSATRLFGSKDDLTTVIQILPSGSVVDVIDGDSTYYHVLFENQEGYIFRRHASLNDSQISTQDAGHQQNINQEEQSAQEPQVSRFTYLENKYGSSMAARLMAGKIWKGMNSEMVRDSWGAPKRINRLLRGNNIREEWIYNNSWLHIENNTLVDWGPIMR